MRSNTHVYRDLVSVGLRMGETKQMKFTKVSNRHYLKTRTSVLEENRTS